MSRTMTHIMGILSVAVLLANAGGLAGCRGDRTSKPPRQFFPDMDDQPRWNPQDKSDFYENHRTMRQPPANTVAFGTTGLVSDAPWAEDRDDLLRESSEIYEGVDASGAFVTKFPIPVTTALMERGRNRYNIYCSVCHGYNAEGASAPDDAHPNGQGGMVGRRFGIPVPSFHDPKYLAGAEKGSVGFLFFTARNGVGKPGTPKTMPGYAYALDAKDAWAVVAYIRALQRSEQGTLEDVPETMRSQFGAGAANPTTSSPSTEGQP